MVMNRTTLFLSTSLEYCFPYIVLGLGGIKISLIKNKTELAIYEPYDIYMHDKVFYLIVRR
jgi:hypothetical protein